MQSSVNLPENMPKLVGDLIRSIDLCREQRLILPTLTLIYSGIDICASLFRPEHAKRVKGTHFSRWAEKFMECEKALGVAGIELYSARCGVVHTYSSDSNYTEENKARRIYYAWGDASPEPLMAIITELGRSEVVIHMDRLVEAFQEGMIRFFEEVDRDAELQRLVLRRFQSMFSNQPGDITQWKS